MEGCDGLLSRAKRLGLQLKGFLGEGVTVCIAASSPGGAGGRGGSEGAGDETAAAGTGAGLSRGQRLSRIHRMVRPAKRKKTFDILTIMLLGIVCTPYKEYIRGATQGSPAKTWYNVIQCYKWLQTRRMMQTAPIAVVEFQRNVRE